MGLQFGIFDHIEPVPGLTLAQIYRERLLLLERYDAAGFYAYHLAEHHTPAVHSLAPSQNVFLATASQRTRQLRLAPCVYVLPLHHPLQQPYPPMWYMRNVETAARDGMNAIIVGSLDSFEANVIRYRELWDEYHGVGARTLQGTEPKIGLVHHIVLAATKEEAVAIARPAWQEYVWNLEAPRRLEAEQRGLTQFLGANMNKRPAGLPDREADRERYRLPERPEVQRRRRVTPGGLGGEGRGAGFNVIAGTPDSIRTYMDEYVTTGAHYFVCSFQWGNLTHDQAKRSIDLFIEDIMPHYL